MASKNTVYCLKCIVLWVINMFRRTLFWNMQRLWEDWWRFEFVDHRPSPLFWSSEFLVWCWQVPLWKMVCTICITLSLVSEAFRGHQILLNHAKQKRKGNTFLSPSSKSHQKELQKRLILHPVVNQQVTENCKGDQQHLPTTWPFNLRLF